jgi:hypothetical protein
VTPPVILLGVSRSGTTLLRVILDRSPGLAIPDESFFVPPRRATEISKHPRRRLADPDDRGWGVRRGSRVGCAAGCHGDAMAAIFEAYAAAAGKLAGATRRRCACATSRLSGCSGAQ